MLLSGFLPRAKKKKKKSRRDTAVEVSCLLLLVVKLYQALRGPFNYYVSRVIKLCI